MSGDEAAGAPVHLSAGERMQRVELVIVDVDGVLTDGRIVIDDHGVERKNFHVLDGSAVWLLRRAGLETAIISGRYAACVTVRARQLQIQQCHQGALDKVAAFEKVIAHHGVAPEACAYMGDDLLDVRLLRRVGLAAAPHNARPEVKRVCHVVTRASGGEGALRELAEAILRAKGLLEPLLRDRYGVEG